ncbi:hypothetical protein BCR34DRAFT_599922 [Clohesyomyces aquaticus]|uniref:Cupin 2 conserved barrel domain-containing protein n=1 Tax=Clohesyomyces aquaticus TaxID=1231657 RepID=A0A1Y1ZT01_9PLEO|nr:hypothetical protein BCR34DRAFT_599922 [Clohesyomyces aquaticus]
MAPPRPKSTTAGQDPIVVFNGAISVRQLTHPDRLFNLEVTFDDHHAHMRKLREQTPPQHFQYLQVEFMKVLKGSIYINVGEKRILLTPSNNELEIPTWTRNQAISGPLSIGGAELHEVLVKRPGVSRSVHAGCHLLRELLQIHRPSFGTR